jgi:hypothetical protein
MLRSLLMSRYLEMSSKFGRVFMAISGMVMAGVAIAPAPAQAAAKLPPLGKTVWPLAYNKSYCAYNQGHTRAIKVQLSGKLQYTRTVEKFNKNIRVMFHDPAVVDPKLSVTVLTKCSNGKKVKIDRIFAVQSWYAWKCGNISVSVKSPWGKTRFRLLTGGVTHAKVPPLPGTRRVRRRRGTGGAAGSPSARMERYA